MRNRRRLGLGLLVLGALIVLGGVWIVVTGLLARAQLNAVRAELHQLRGQIDNDDFTAASATAKRMRAHAHRAHEYTTGPAWALAGAVPVGGAPMDSVRGIAAAADRLSTSALPALLAARDTLDPTQLRRPDGSIDLGRIESVAPQLARADATTMSATRRIEGLARHTWLAPVDTARSDLVGQLVSLRKTVHSANLAAQSLPDLLGASGTRRYFVTFQNDAESRGTGGLPGAFGIADVTHGKISFSGFYNDDTLDRVSVNPDFGPDYAQLYLGTRSTSLYVNSNLSANYPYAAQIWIAMWEKHSGQHLDGAIAVDPTALSYLLGVVGPASLPDGTQITSGNVVALTQSTAYTQFPDRNERRAFLRQVASAVSSHIVNSRASLHQIVDAAGRASGERRLLVWSADPAMERIIEQTSVSGEIPETAAPYVGLSVVNDGGNKLDYYLDRSVAWQSSGCGRTRTVTVTVRLTNDAPATGLPDAVTSRSDRHADPVRRGDNRLEVSYYATSGAALASADLDGVQTDVEIGAERGHPVFRLDVELPRGTTRTLVLHLSEPGGAGAPVVLRQPLVRPLAVTLDQQHC